MIVSLRGNQRSLHTRQNLFCLRQRQPQIGDLGKAGGSIDLYQVDTSAVMSGPVSTSRKIQPMHDPPVKKTKTVVSLPAPYPQSLDSPFSLWIFQSGLTPWRQPRWASRGLCPASSSPLRRWRGLARGGLPAFRAREARDCMRRAIWSAACPRHARTTGVFVSGGGVGWSWSLGLLRRKLADKQETTRAAARADARIIRLFRVGGRIGGVRADLGSKRHRLRVEQKQQPGAGGILAPDGMPQAEVADLVQALGQDMLEEAAHELLAGDAAGPPPVGFAMLVADGDGLIVEADNAGVGDRDAEDVAGEVIEHGLFALAPGRAMDDPGLGPGGVGQNQIGTFLLERGPELAAHELGQGLGGNQEGSARRSPIGAVIGNAAPGDQAVDVRVVEQLLH